MWTTPRRATLDHDDFGSNRSKIMNVIDSNKLEHDVVRKPLRTFRHHALGAIVLAASLMAAPQFAAAVPDSNPNPVAPSVDSGKTFKQKSKKKSTKSKKKKKQQKSERGFRSGYRHAYELIYRRHDHAGGIAALRALGHDENSSVATLIGYASRKLGRYDDAKYWYDKALAANPRNETTLSYLGMWHAEQGNRLKAQDYLAKVRDICGNTECKAYAALRAAIAGTGTY
jgi:tetratricopeptide (TPR) repeat protein